LTTTGAAPGWPGRPTQPEHPARLLSACPRLVFEGRKTADEGLDAAVVRGNAILRAFRVMHGAAGQCEI
jgi:hypothetical protein